MNRLAPFDCDGTLVDSQHTICVAMEHGFAAAATTIGVAWGYHDETELLRAGTHHVVGAPIDILELARAAA